MSVATPNMDQMVARLIKLSPPMLQEFAAEHQNDTYALLAAKAASEAQKKMMAANRPQQMGIPPKVNEQVVASIAQPPQAPQAAPQAQGLPEESGIAQLPAQNMQGMAGGGIVAFAGGGVNDAETFVDSLGIERNARTGDPVKSMFQRMGEFRDREQAKTAMPAVPVANAADQRMLRPALAPIAALATDERPYTERNLATRQPGIASLANTEDNAAKLDAEGNRVGGAGSSDTGGSLTSLLKKIQAAQGEPTDPEAGARKQLQASEEAMAGEELKDAQARKEGLAALLGGKESRIKGREDRAEKAENLNTKMAVINAGLAMMQSTGRGLAGIAEGATKGMGMYAEGLKLTAAERQKLEDAKDSFDELRFNSENMTQKEITAARNKITNAANTAIKGGMDARDKNRSEKREDSGNIFTAEAAARQGKLNRAAQLQAAGMPSGQERLFKTLGDGDVKKGFQLFTDANQEGKGTQALLQAYVKDPMLLADLKTSNPVLYKQISTMIAAQLAGPIVTQPVAGSHP